MHITLETKTFQKVLETVSRISTKHITLPVLQCVLIEASGSKVCVRATNLEIGIEGVIDAKIEEEGTVAVPAHILLQTIHFVTQPSITLSLEGDVLLVESKTSRTEIKSVAAGDFPTIPKIKGDTLTIQGSLFAHGIKTAAVAASLSSIKPELGCVYIHQKKEHSLTFVATDSFRLMEKTIPQKNLILSETILIPYKNALELARVVEDAPGDVALSVSENQCAVQVGPLYVTTRLVSGTFPDYESIIPKEYKTQATLLQSDLTQGLKKTNIFLNKFMQLTITLAGGIFTLSTRNSDAGATTESLHATVEGEDLVLNFNQRYVHDVMGHIHDDSVVLKCAGIGRPMVIENAHDKSLRYLVMPMNK